MKEIREIVRAVDGLDAGERAVLATVVDLQGSGYRLPGARMLIWSDGRTVGTVSGGCLEADVLERSNRVLADGRPEIFTYDTTGDENSVFSMNMGCRGVIRILVEPIDKNSPLIAALRRVWERREGVTIVTLISGENEIGSRYFWSTEAGFLRPSAPEMLIDTAQAFDQFYSHAKGTDHAVAELDLSRGRFEAFFERLSPPVKLMIYGAGADAVPLARLGYELGWQVTVADHRTAYLTDERFPTAQELKLEDRVLAVNVDADHRSAIAIMTHNFDRDRLILPAALVSPAFYVGVLGPKSRSQQLLDEIFNDPGILPPGRLYTPIGLDIGGHTPESIALAIVAEIQSVLRSRSGGHLREREGSIYERS